MAFTGTLSGTLSGTLWDFGMSHCPAQCPGLGHWIVPRMVTVGQCLAATGVPRSLQPTMKYRNNAAAQSTFTLSFSVHFVHSREIRSIGLTV